MNDSPQPAVHRTVGGTSGSARVLSIVHILAPAPFGGLESVVQALAAGHTERGDRVRVVAVVTPAADEHPFVSGLRRAGVEVTELSLPARAYLEERRRVVELCKELGADLIHTHGFRPDVLHAATARSLGIPQVSTIHGFIGGTWRSRLYEYMQTRTFRRLDAVIAVSRPIVERLRRAGVSEEQIHLVPNAFRPGELLASEVARQELGVPSNAFHIGWVGRLSREKGGDLLVEAVARLDDLPIVVSIIGAGPERDALQRRVEELGIIDRFRWHGSIAAASRFFGGFDAYVLSSRTEGTPIALFEAMAAGVPIIATAVGGVPDVISDREALLVPREDPAALATAIRTLHDDNEGAEDRAHAARARLDAFALGPWLDTHEQIYRSLLETTIHPGPEVR